MLNKIYLIALAVFVLIMVFLTYLAFSQLQSQGFAPSVIAERFSVKEGYFWQFLWLSAVVLLVLANILLWTKRSAWALWTTFGYFALFVILETWWINRIFLSYQKDNSLTETTFSFFGLGGTLLCIIVAIGIFFNQFIVLQMRDRMHGVEKPVEAGLPAEIPPAEKEVE